MGAAPVHSVTPSGPDVDDPRRRVPRTDALLADPRLVEAQRLLGRTLVKDVVAQAQQRARVGEFEPDEVADHAVAALPASASSLRPVINATGVVVHTNLGRAALSQAAVDAVVTASGATDVEFDLETGRRGRRGRGALAALAAAVPAAGGVHVVNNNAAALLLTAMTLAPGKEIVVSRGELIEIGDGFRLPELMESAGSRIREVGTTNRTHLHDYADAIGPDTGLVLKVHPSNYHVSGFTSAVPIAELATLVRGGRSDGSAHPTLVVDIGSGLLSPHPLLPDEPDADSALSAGAAVVTASGDKLLGGPQAGLLFGEAGLIERLRRHPAARALRVDKLTLAALEATLVGPPPPVAQALDADVTELHARAERLTAQLPGAQTVNCVAAVGGGGAPDVELPSVAVSLPESYAAPLRTGAPAVVGRLEGGRCLLDLRTVAPSDDESLLRAVLACSS
jgi:L-seryl-tRNA(Ser) seleniumtransferase